MNERRRSISVLPSFASRSSLKLDNVKQQAFQPKRNLTFEKWNKQIEERQKLKQKKVEELIQIEREKSEVKLKRKYKRKISFDQWMEIKQAGGSDVNDKIESSSNQKEHQQKSNDAFQKWLIKKEKQKLEEEERRLEEERFRLKKFQERLQDLKDRKSSFLKLRRRASVM